MYYIYGCGRLTKFGAVIRWENSLGGSGLAVGIPSWKIAYFKHPFGFQWICFSLMCLTQQSKCKSNHEPAKTRFVPKTFENRSTAEIQNEFSHRRAPNEFSHRRNQTFSGPFIACLCAKNANPTAPGWGRGISRWGAVGFPLVELGRALGGAVDHSTRKNLSQKCYGEKYLCQLACCHTWPENTTSRLTET